MPSRSQLKRWRALGRRKGREEHGLALAEGPRLLEALLDSSVAVRHLLYTDDAAAAPATAALLDRARSAQIPCERVEARDLEALADTVTPQGTMAVFEVAAHGWSDLPAGDLLVLDGVQDPGNLGTLLRTAEGLGVGGAVSVEGTVDPWNPKAVRASAGSIFRVPVVRAARAEAAERLKVGGWSVWAADPAGEPFRRGDVLPARVALVLGNEGRGVSAELLAAADRRVAIAMAADVESLNVAVAAAILMDRIFSSRKQRC
jgi:RNA methyltransferase, TrmH family